MNFCITLLAQGKRVEEGKDERKREGRKGALPRIGGHACVYSLIYLPNALLRHIPRTSVLRLGDNIKLLRFLRKRRIKGPRKRNK